MCLINNVLSFGEVYIHALIAFNMGVPLLAVSGDGGLPLPAEKRMPDFTPRLSCEPGRVAELVSAGTR